MKPYRTTYRLGAGHLVFTIASSKEFSNQNLILVCVFTFCLFRGGGALFPRQF